MDINANEFDEIARNVFAPAYPVIAEQIKNKTGKTSGKCLDIGCGGGYLGLNLALITDFKVCLFDESKEMLKIAERNISSYQLETRVTTLSGDVHQIPLPDASIDLAISRGSVFFWKDKARAFKDIYRLLAPEGIAYIGGGFGTAEIKKQITAKMLKRNADWLEKVKQRTGNKTITDFKETLQLAKIPAFEIKKDEAGLWIVFHKKQL